MNIAEITDTIDQALRAARTITLHHFRQPLEIQNKLKTDFDPVTRADKDAEIALKQVILNQFGDHGFIGEEFAADNPDAQYKWVIDPIDGTRSFISGVPMWGTLVGLMSHQNPVIGAADIAALDETYLGTTEGASLKHAGNTQTLTTSKVTELDKAILCSTDAYLFDASSKALFERVRTQTPVQRYGLDCYGYCLLAAGHLDLVIEPDLKPVDIVALVPIVEGAGGVITTWQGTPAFKGGHIVAAATPQLHAKALSILKA